MKKLLLILVLSPILCFSQKKLSLKFINSKASPSQYINSEFIKLESIKYLDTLCVYAVHSVKFTVKTKGEVTNITPSVGFPVELIDNLEYSIKVTEGHWDNSTGDDINCILPIVFIPAFSCNVEPKIELEQSTSQMFKYTGEFKKFMFDKFFDNNIDIVQGVILSPILLVGGSIK